MTALDLPTTHNAFSLQDGTHALGRPSSLQEPLGGGGRLQMAQGEGTNKDLGTGHMVQVLALTFISYTFFLLELKKQKKKIPVDFSE